MRSLCLQALTSKLSLHKFQSHETVPINDDNKPKVFSKGVAIVDFFTYIQTKRTSGWLLTIKVFKQQD